MDQRTITVSFQLLISSASLFLWYVLDLKECWRVKRVWTHEFRIFRKIQTENNDERGGGCLCVSCFLYRKKKTAQKKSPAGLGDRTVTTAILMKGFYVKETWSRSCCSVPPLYPPPPYLDLIAHPLLVKRWASNRTHAQLVFCHIPRIRGLTTWRDGEESWREGRVWPHWSAQLCRAKMQHPWDGSLLKLLSSENYKLLCL